MPLRILLIDDNPADLILAEEAFAEHYTDVRVTTCSGAAQALTLLRSPGEFFPDVVITDLNMPGLSGLDLLRDIKDDPALQLIPVVMLSTSSHPKNVAAAYSLHASSYMVKAASFPDFVHQVDAFVAYWRGMQRGRQARY